MRQLLRQLGLCSDLSGFRSRLAAALKELGVAHPSELPPAIANELFRKVLIETAALHNPDADLEAMDRLTRAASNPLFFPALKGARKQADLQKDYFTPATGSDCAIVMAGHGIAVAPFEMPTTPKDAPRLLAPLSDDIDVVASSFAQRPEAAVGYSSCAAPFYILATNCVNTLRQLIVSDDRLRGARHLIERVGFKWPAEATSPFEQALFGLPRKAEDKIPTVFLNGGADIGSIMLYAGWLEGDRPFGAPKVAVWWSRCGLLRLWSTGRNLVLGWLAG
jgi:hypothetical protein